MEIDLDLVSQRNVVFSAARELVDPIIFMHELTDQKIGGPFNTTTVISKVDQHIDQIVRVADWLLETT